MVIEWLLKSAKAQKFGAVTVLGKPTYAEIITQSELNFIAWRMNMCLFCHNITIIGSQWSLAIGYSDACLPQPFWFLP